ncbi:MAG: hypothetical protein ACTTKF_07730 [Bacteroides sp.]
MRKTPSPIILTILNHGRRALSALNPTYWMGWVLLAHGETVGHGAPRHQPRASMINRLPSSRLSLTPARPA